VGSFLLALRSHLGKTCEIGTTHEMHVTFKLFFRKGYVRFSGVFVNRMVGILRYDNNC